ncbi:hypothetical protein HMN09_00913300 [Mycena chlorophos]|uniref:Uncharacterized protein n=1 Tax=Mycena chlorophos TaxID=658473 RepID=A0A8H6W281_MYCCL|nr:hypothetical protein HMN09_00913300 [Mycena chlorophos]
MSSPSSDDDDDDVENPSYPCFLPVYAALNSESSRPLSLALAENSMLIGGTSMYLAPDEPWPLCATCTAPLVSLLQLNASSSHTPAAFRAHIPDLDAPESTKMTLLQLFVCSQEDGDCFAESLGYATETRSWLLRFVHIRKARAEEPRPQDADIIARLAEPGTGTGFLPARFVTQWTQGKTESFKYFEGLEADDDEDDRLTPGLKLLGVPERGKFWCSEEYCTGGDSNSHAGVDHFSWRSLIQLGDRYCEWEEDNALGCLDWLGNVWIEQCKVHPEVLTLTMSGDW